MTPRYACNLAPGCISSEPTFAELRKNKKKKRKKTGPKKRGPRKKGKGVSFGKGWLELGQGTWTTASCLVIIYMGPGWNRTWATWLRSLRLSHCAMAALLFSDTVCLTCPSPCCQSCAGRRIALRQSCAGRRIALHQSGRRIALRQSCAGRRIALHQSVQGAGLPSINPVLCAGLPSVNPVLGAGLSINSVLGAGLPSVNPVLGAGLPPSICAGRRIVPSLPGFEFRKQRKRTNGEDQAFPHDRVHQQASLGPCGAPGAVHRHLPWAIKIGQNRGSDQPDPGAVSRRL